MSNSLARPRLVVAWLLVTRVAGADVCPAEIHGGWEAEISITGLTEITIEIDRDQGGDYSSRLFSSNREEAVQRPACDLLPGRWDADVPLQDRPAYVEPDRGGIA